MAELNNEKEQEVDHKQFGDYLRKLVKLRGDIDSSSIKEDVYKDMVFKGPTVWILICSILIASIGLNVSSTAVVIGAMLISPLMSPIVAIGLAVGTYNWPKLISALKNFTVMVVISLITSYLYFLISPLKVPSAEILARTEPTLLDVFIAFVGGAAGIIAISRKEISNVIPGVAIATALMPPLCTAGFGLATLNFSFFWGGFYLFILNSIMIALATYIVVNYLRFPNFKFVDDKKAKRLKRYMTLFVIAIMIPSIIVFYGLVKNSSFNREADNFIAQVDNVDGHRLMKHHKKYHSDSSIIELLYMDVDPVNIKSIKDKFNSCEIKNTKLIIHQASKSADEMLSEVLSKRNTQDQLRALEETSKSLTMKLKTTRDSLAEANKKLIKFQLYDIPLNDLQKEIKAIFPSLKRISIAAIIEDSKNELEKVPCILVSWNGKPKLENEKKLKEFLKARLKVDDVLIKNL